MTILLRVLLNSTNTQMSQSDSGVIHLLTVCSVHVLLEKPLEMIHQIMHFIYFFIDLDTFTNEYTCAWKGNR